MRRDSLIIWRCPRCFSTESMLNVITETNEIETGNLACLSCRARYEIHRGIIHTDPDISAGVMKEISNARMHTKPVQGLVFPLTEPTEVNDQWLLTLPQASYHAGSWNPADDVRHFIIRCGLKSSDRVLDLGAGVCWTSRDLAVVSDHVVAVDVLDDKYLGLESAETYFASTGRYFDRVNASMDRLPFRDHTFDMVLTNCSAHHADDLLALLTEIKRVLKPDGRYVMSNELTQGWLKRSRLVGNDHFYRLSDYLRILRQAGFGYTTAFPRSIMNTLKNGGSGRKDGRWQALGKIAGSFYKFPGAPRVIELLRRPLSELFGIPLIIIARPK